MIIERLISERLSDEQIVKYVDCFDSRILKRSIKMSRNQITENLKKLIIMVCINDSCIFYNEDPVLYMMLVKKLYSLDLDDDFVIRALKLLTFFYAPQSDGK